MMLSPNQVHNAGGKPFLRVNESCFGNEHIQNINRQKLLFSSK
jgi:hypothetical protein